MVNVSPQKGASTVMVEVAGQKYPLRGDGAEEHLRKLAAFVDEKVREIQNGTRIASTQHLLVLAALNIADELFAAQARAHRATDQAQTTVERVLARIERALAEAGGAPPEPPSRGFARGARDAEQRKIGSPLPGA